MTAFDWWPDWSGYPCVIVASGPSAKTANLADAKGSAKFLAVNDSWKLAPWSDALYACDFSWWRVNNGLPAFQGMKISQDAKAAKSYRDVRLVNCDRGIEKKEKLLLDQRGLIGWGGNGGFHALNLAVQFGCKKIVLVGFDMRTDKGFHWHGKHQAWLNNPQPHHVQRWRKVMDDIAPTLIDAGVAVVNASEMSALTAYPKMPLKEALA